MSVCGIECAAFAAILMIAIVLRGLFFGDSVAGWLSIISVILFVGGLQLTCLGILGQYLAKTYLETKRRPLYFISEESNSD